LSMVGWLLASRGKMNEHYNAYNIDINITLINIYVFIYNPPPYGAIVKMYGSIVKMYGSIVITVP
jgi:hypothetical protein